MFHDHELIASLGCESILNLPVCHKGLVIGTLNLLHGAGWYDAGDIPLGQVFAALAAPAFLALDYRLSTDPSIEEKGSDLET